MQSRLDKNRFFDPNPDVRSIANELYEGVCHLPLVCPHGHVEATVLADNKRFPNPTALLIQPDHYVVRMLFSKGIPLERLGIDSLDGSRVESDPREVWKTFCSNYYLFRGTPTRAWLDYEMHYVFDVDEPLNAGNASEIYDHIDHCLSQPEFLPRSLYNRFNIEVLTTTDGATDSLADHDSIRKSEWDGRVIPCFRPDALFQIASPEWKRELDQLAVASQTELSSYKQFLVAIENRRAFFKEMGATSTDHGVESPQTQKLSTLEVSRLFEKALSATATESDEHAFEAHMLIEMARMSTEDGLVMQIHPGSFRNHNEHLFARFGRDLGADIPVRTEFTRSLHALLNAYGNDSRFRLIVFTLDESTYGRELAPLAGHYPALVLGPPWWFFDSFAGMRRYREAVTETAGFYNSAGFNDDTRAFVSIPARHDLARRADADYVAGLVARHQIDIREAHEIMHALSYSLAKESYRLDT